MLEDMLVDFGCIVVGPAGGIEDALATIEAREADAAVLDVNLRGRRAYPVADVLGGAGHPLRVRDRLREKPALRAYRCYPYLLKPYCRQAMHDALQSLLAPDAAAPGRGCGWSTMRSDGIA